MSNRFLSVQEQYTIAIYQMKNVLNLMQELEYDDKWLAYADTLLRQLVDDQPNI